MKQQCMSGLLAALSDATYETLQSAHFPLCPYLLCVSHQVHITQLVEPEVVDGRGGCREVILSEPSVHLIHSKRAAAEDPAVNDSLLASCLSTCKRDSKQE